MTALRHLTDNLRHSIERYHKDVMVVETAYPAWDIHPSAAAARYMKWPMTPAGQEAFLSDLIKTVKAAPEGRGIGVIYWHPEATYMPDTMGRRARRDPNSLFDAKGQPLPAMDVLSSGAPVP